MKKTNQTEKQSDRKTQWAILLQSLGVFLLAYLFVYLLSGLSVLYIAYDLDIPARLFGNRIEFGITETNPLWTGDAIVSVFMSKPVSSFIMATISILMLLLLKPKKFWIQLFYIWVFLHGFNFTFGLLSEDLLLQRGLFRVANVMDIRQIALTLTIGISIFFLLKAGSLAGKLYFSKVFQLKPENKNTQLINFQYTFLIPFFVGSLLVLILNFNATKPKDFLLIASMFLSLIPIIFTKTAILKTSNFTAQPILSTAFILISIALTTLIFFYLVLKEGIILG